MNDAGEPSAGVVKLVEIKKGATLQSRPFLNGFVFLSFSDSIRRCLLCLGALCCVE